MYKRQKVHPRCITKSEAFQHMYTFVIYNGNDLRMLHGRVLMSPSLKQVIISLHCRYMSDYVYECNYTFIHKGCLKLSLNTRCQHMTLCFDYQDSPCFVCLFIITLTQTRFYITMLLISLDIKLLFLLMKKYF